MISPGCEVITSFLLSSVSIILWNPHRASTNSSSWEEEENKKKMSNKYRVWRIPCPLFQEKLFCLWQAAKKNGVHSSERSYLICGTSVSLCLVIQRTDEHLGHHSSAHFSGQAILSVLSSLPNWQVELKVGHEKEKTLLPTGQVHLNLYLLPCTRQGRVCVTCPSDK